MKILFIDTSTSYCTVSIINDNEILFNYNEFIKEDMSSKILPIIELAFSQLNFSLSETDKIFIVNGPGSFTGIRIGVSIAKTIAWGFGIPIIPISSLEFLATTNTNKKYVIPMIDARRGNVYGAIYDNNLNIVRNDSLISKKQLLDSISDNYMKVSNDFDDCELPNVDVIRVINKHINDIPINPHNLNPKYLKLTEAEESKLKYD